MPIRDNREYRSIPVFESRSDNEDSYVVCGYASTFDEYELFKDGDDVFCERIEPTAFEQTDMRDCIFQRDHNSSVMARTRNGTIQLSVDDHGLYTKTDLSKTQAARDMFEEIRTGMYDQMSFAFTVAEDSIERDRESKKYVRVIKRISKLYDISAVSIPANPGTDIGVSARSAFDGFIESEKQEMLRAKELELAKAKAKAKT